MRGSTPLGRVLGLGSAKDGAGHWWTQRVTAVALVPLTVWFLLSLASLPLADHAAVAGWLRHSLHAVPTALLVVTLCWHSRLGVQVVVEDYVHHHALKVTSLLLSTFAHALVAATGVFAVLRIAFAA
jgi:succinate dehydrogenase / fumarate reductase membrane anchor subunit